MKHNIIKLNVPRETFGKVELLRESHHPFLSRYVDQLLWWNKRINLVSRNVSRETVEKHVQHSLLLSHLEIFESSDIIVDAGSGGGLPGLAVACCYPEKTFIINDIVSKKVLATKQIAKAVGLENVAFIDGSIERIVIEEPFLLVSKHAFKINDLLKMIRTKPWRKIVLYKGLPYKEELSGINTPLDIVEFDLSNSTGDKFYEGKALLEIALTGE